MEFCEELFRRVRVFFYNRQSTILFEIRGNVPAVYVACGVYIMPVSNTRNISFALGIYISDKRDVTVYVEQRG